MSLLSTLKIDSAFDGTGHNTMSFTVPSGVTEDCTVVIALAGSVPGITQDMSVTSAGVATTLVPPDTSGNQTHTCTKVRGVTSGQDISFNVDISLYQAAVLFFTGDVDAASYAKRDGVSDTSTIIPPTTVATGTTTYAVAMLRKSTASVGETLTNDLHTLAEVYEEYVSSNSTNQSITVAQFEPFSGDSGTTTAVGDNPVSTYNGAGFLLLETEPVAPDPTPTVYAGWFSSFDQDAVTCGWMTKNITSVRMVLSTASDLSSPTYSSAVTVPSHGWVNARITGLTPGTLYHVGVEIDGTLSADGRLQGRTMATGPMSYVALTGSCQQPGDPLVFETMLADNAVFLAHQGDLHYSDTNGQAVWRQGMQNSMTASRFAALTASMPMSYCADNHDWTGQPNPDSLPWTSPDPDEMIRELSGDTYPDAHDLYRTWVYGRVRWIQLDLWGNRDPEDATEGSDKRCITDAQEQWLYSTLEAAQEPLIILLTKWPMYSAPFIGAGRWGSYRTQADRIAAWINSRPAIRDRMVGIGGDSHNLNADTGANQNALGVFPTLNVSPFSGVGGLAAGTWDIANQDLDDSKGYYSRVSITDEGAAVTMRWEAVQDDGQVMASYTKTSGASADVTVAVWDGTQEVPASVSVWDGTQEVLASLSVST